MKNRVAIHCGTKIKYVPEVELQSYIDQGYRIGTGSSEKQKSQRKKWYTDGFTNIIISSGETIPDGFKPGMRKHPGTFSQSKYHWYTDGINDRRIKEGDEVPQGWIQGQSISHKEKNRLGNIQALKIASKPYSDEFKSLYHNKQASIELLSNNPLTISELSERFNAPINSIWPWIVKFELTSYLKHQKESVSKFEDDILEFLCTMVDPSEVIRHDRKTLENSQELDIYLPKYHLAIECNGCYWHSDAYISSRLYHLNKSKLASDKGIRLIHIYDIEWYDISVRPKIESLLKISLKKAVKSIYARKCEVRELTNKEARTFNEANHLQGHRNAQVTYGLFSNGTLVQLMSFSKTKYNRNLKGDNDWEIIRGCPGSNNIVVGGVSKLFTHFLREHNPDSVFSYCDFNKFDGKGYEAIGMKFIGYTGPDLHYLVGNQIIKRNPKKYSAIKNLKPLKIYGAGSKKYLWVKEIDK